MPNKVYYAPETAISFKDSGGDEPLTLNSLAADAVRVSDRYDKGTGSHPMRYKLRAFFSGFATAPVVGETVDVWISTSDGTNPDGDIGVADAAGSVNDLPNCDFAVAVAVQSTTAGDEITDSAIVHIPDQYFSIVVHNNTADALEGSGSHEITLTPIPPEIQ